MFINSTTLQQKITQLTVSILLGTTFLCVNAQEPKPSQTLKQSLKQENIGGGIMVYVGFKDTLPTHWKQHAKTFLIQALCRNQSDVDKLRDQIQENSSYGKVSANHFDGKRLPYADNLINVVVLSTAQEESLAEVVRVISPGGVLYIKSIVAERRKEVGQQLKTLGMTAIGGEKGGMAFSKMRSNDIDNWTHFLHGPDNNAVSSDKIVAAPRSIQWSCGPRYARSHEEMASTSVMVSAGGKIFYITDLAPVESIRFAAKWKLVARDAFNGTILWEKPIKSWVSHLRDFRSGPTHLPRRLVVVGNSVYVTTGYNQPVSKLDATTGKLLKTYEGTDNTEEILVHKGMLYLMVGSSEKNVTRKYSQRKSPAPPAPTKERECLVVNEASGKIIWRKNATKEDYALPSTLTVSGDSLFYQSLRGLVHLSAKDGTERWTAARKTIKMRYTWSAPTLVVADDVVLLMDKMRTNDGPNCFRCQPKEKVFTPLAKDTIKWVLRCSNLRHKTKGVPKEVDGLMMFPGSELKAYSTTTGKELWSRVSSSAFNSPGDVFVNKGLVWIGPIFKNGYDLHTGKVKVTLEKTSVVQNKTFMVHDRCYRNKATQNYILTSRSGIELIDYEKGIAGNNSWIRGVCQYGVMPANGFLYVPPDACACAMKCKLQGLNAMTEKLPKSAYIKTENLPRKLIKGGVYDKIDELLNISDKAGVATWSTYRKDNQRSSATTMVTPKHLRTKWTTSVGGKLTQPVIGLNKLFVASEDLYTVFALDANSGEKLWKFVAGGSIDSSPTLHKGLLFFGSTDGWVYCLDATTGKLAWKYQAAPEERMICNYGHLESTWPVHGSVIIRDDALYFTAGRSSYVDGGIIFHKLDLHGNVLLRKRISHIDPKTGKQTSKESKWFIEGTLNDILSADDSAIYLKHMALDSSGNEIAKPDYHLFKPTGFLETEGFYRSYWVYGNYFGEGCGAWSRASKIFPSSKIACFDDATVFGYGRTKVDWWAGHLRDTYHLFAEGKPTANSKIRKSTERMKWGLTDFPLTVNAMLLSGKHLIVAGTPDVEKKTKAFLAFDNNDEVVASRQGKQGVFIYVVNKIDGKEIARAKLSGVPNFDGMSAAYGKIYLALKKGSITCIGE